METLTVLPCSGCAEALEPDDIVWSTLDGAATVERGIPWCAGCCPEQY